MAKGSTTSSIDFILSNPSNRSISSDNGHVTLHWNIELARVVQLEQSSTRSFKDGEIIYTGKDKSRFISGLSNGNYYFRIRTVGGVWSDVLLVKIQHMSLSFALSLLSLGALVFLSTVLVIVHGIRTGASSV